MSVTLNKVNAYELIFAFYKPYKYLSILYILANITMALMGPFTSFLNKYVINGLLQAKSGDFSLLFLGLGLRLLNIGIMEVMSTTAIKTISYRIEQAVKNNIIAQVFESVLHRSCLFFYASVPGQLAERIVQVATSIQKIVHLIGPQFILAITQLVAVLVIVYLTKARFFYIFLVFMLLYGALAMYASKKIVLLSRTHGTKESAVSGNVVDCIVNVNLIEVFNTQSQEVKVLKHLLSITQQTFRARQKREILFYLGQAGMILAMMAIVSINLVSLYKQNAITAGDFSLILSIGFGLTSSVLEGLTWYNRLSEELGICNQGLSILGSADPDGTNDLVIQGGTIAFNKVTFAYPDNPAIVQDLSLKVRAGQKVGFVGFSGSGKSTCAHLILRLVRASSGAITIDGQNLLTLTRKSLSESIGYVPQNTLLFQRTILENLRYGKLDATDEEVIAISKAVGLHNVIMKLPFQYETIVSNSTLSGGEKQRLGLARVLLQNPSIFIFDEATSQLDNITEREIYELIAEATAGKTCIFISHRLTNMELFDNIMVFEKGKVVESGTHSELLKKKGIYTRLTESKVQTAVPG